MTPGTERAKVIQVTFPTALHDRDDVIRLPQMSGALGALTAAALNRIDRANSTDAVVALKHPAAHMRGAGANHPAIHAAIAAKGATTLRNLNFALAA